MALITDQPLLVAASSETTQPLTDNYTNGPLATNGTSRNTYIEYVVLAMGAFGTVVNALMLFVLAYFKKNHEQSTNKLILNQTALDLLCCSMLMISSVFKLANPYFRSDTGGYILCDLLDGNVLFVMGLTGSPVGLVVIAFERYVKIVHAVFHRRYYRPWMIWVGIALPWVYSAVTQATSSIVATAIIDGQCLPVARWPHAEDQLNYAIVAIMGNYILPVIIFAYCYGRIAFVISRKLAVAPVSVAVVTSTNQPTSDAATRKSSAKQKNVIQTMVFISVFFAVCWLPTTVSQMVFSTGHGGKFDPDSVSFLAVEFVCYINMVLNPLLYAWQYETVRQSVRLLIKGRGRDASETTNVGTRSVHLTASHSTSAGHA